MIAFPIHNPAIPCQFPIPGGMFPGRMLRFQGSILPVARRFEINLICANNMGADYDEIALHVNPRFEEQAVVRNHLGLQAWGDEEREGRLPLAPGQRFEALLLCEPDVMKVALNGVHFCDFRHRIPYTRISHLAVIGDVTIQLIAIEGTLPPAPHAQQAVPAIPPPTHGAPGYGPPPQGFY